MKPAWICFAACTLACATDPLRPTSARSTPEWDGLDRPRTCSEQTLRTLKLPLGSIRVVRQSRVESSGRAIVASEPFSCAGFTRSRCITRAEQYAQRRAFWLGLSTRLAPTEDDPSEVLIRYIEPSDRAHRLPAAEIDYELPWGERDQRRALRTLALELDRQALELDERSERDVVLVLGEIESEPAELAAVDDDPEAARALAMPRIAAAPRVLRLGLRCQADSGGRAPASAARR